MLLPFVITYIELWLLDVLALRCLVCDRGCEYKIDLRGFVIEPCYVFIANILFSAILLIKVLFSDSIELEVEGDD